MNANPANAKNRASAVVTRQTAHNACAQPSRRSVRLSITETQAAKIGILERWQSAWSRKRSRAARKAIVSSRLQEVLSQLDDLAANQHPKPWSQRKLAAKVGLPESTLRKIKQGQADPVIWLPRIQAAAHKLTATNSPS